jgi:hypothetical protein
MSKNLSRSASVVDRVSVLRLSVGQMVQFFWASLPGFRFLHHLDELTKVVGSFETEVWASLVFRHLARITRSSSFVNLAGLR